MINMMESILGEQWHELPPALQAHYKTGNSTEIGHLDIEYPRFMQPYLSLMRCFGALINRQGKQLATQVDKRSADEKVYWHRSIRYPDTKVVHFDSIWQLTPENHIIEFVNSLLGLQMVPEVKQGKMHYRGICFVMKLGRWLLPIPEWLVLGHTTIVEEAIDDTHFAMDFRLTHQLLGQLFRYSGVFSTVSDEIKT